MLMMHMRAGRSLRGAATGLSVLAMFVASAMASQAGGRVDMRTPAAAAPKSSSTSAATKYGWGRVVAGDEFSYTGAPDGRKWRVYNSRGHAGLGLRRPAAWRVDGVAATVTGDTHGTTGGMSSRYGQKYGRWEARMRTSLRDPKYHPNVLLWPHVRGTTTCPEVNFAEGTADRRFVNFFLHYGCAPRQVHVKRALDMTEWHNYAVEWTPTHITGYIDGVAWFRSGDRNHLPKVAMHATMQLDWMPNKAATRRTTMTVNWIRVYRP
jgi:hypothetical protein